MEVCGADLAMVGSGVMFGEVITEVVSSFTPVYEELVLFDAILDPVKSHVHRFGLTLP